MNERIKELWTQAKEELNQDFSSGKKSIDIPKTWDDMMREKFAELIVRECIKINKEQLKSVPKDQKDWDGHNYGFTAAVYGFKDLVKEHFGVEE